MAQAFESVAPARGSAQIAPGDKPMRRSVKHGPPVAANVSERQASVLDEVLLGPVPNGFGRGCRDVQCVAIPLALSRSHGENSNNFSNLIAVTMSLIIGIVYTLDDKVRDDANWCLIIPENTEAPCELFAEMSISRKTMALVAWATSITLNLAALGSTVAVACASAGSILQAAGGGTRESVISTGSLFGWAIIAMCLTTPLFGVAVVMKTVTTQPLAFSVVAVPVSAIVIARIIAAAMRSCAELVPLVLLHMPLKWTFMFIPGYKIAGWEKQMKIDAERQKEYLLARAIDVGWYERRDVHLSERAVSKE